MPSHGTDLPEVYAFPWTCQLPDCRNTPDFLPRAQPRRPGTSRGDLCQFITSINRRILITVKRNQSREYFGVPVECRVSNGQHVAAKRSPPLAHRCPAPRFGAADRSVRYPGRERALHVLAPAVQVATEDIEDEYVLVSCGTEWYRVQLDEFVESTTAPGVRRRPRERKGPRADRR